MGITVWNMLSPQIVEKNAHFNMLLDGTRYNLR
jgi:hypothetical protein